MMDSTGKMDERVIHLVAANSEYLKDSRDPMEVFECLREEFSEVHSEFESSHRWWDEWLHVVKVGECLVGYVWGRANRDEGMGDLGYMADLGAVRLYEEYEKTVKAYRAIR